jgi:hypothetical protein
MPKQAIAQSRTTARMGRCGATRIGTLTNSVYLPHRDASPGAQTQTRRINFVGLKRHPESGWVGDKAVRKVCAQDHAQIMTAELTCVLICAIEFPSNAQAGECPLRGRAPNGQPSCKNRKNAFLVTTQLNLLTRYKK